MRANKIERLTEWFAVTITFHATAGKMVIDLICS